MRRCYASRSPPRPWPWRALATSSASRDDATITNEAAEAIKAAFPVPVKSVRVQCGAQNVDCPVPLTVRGTQALVSFAPLAFKLFCAARGDSPFPPSKNVSLAPRVPMSTFSKP